MPGNLNFWSIVTSRLFVVVAIIAFGLIGVGVVKGIMRYTELYGEITKLENDITALQSKNQNLNRLIGYLSTNEFKERVARLQLNMQKPGEHVVAIPGINGGDSQISANAVDTNQTQITERNWKKWLKYFFP